MKMAVVDLRSDEPVLSCTCTSCKFNFNLTMTSTNGMVVSIGLLGSWYFKSLSKLFTTLTISPRAKQVVSGLPALCNVESTMTLHLHVNALPFWVNKVCWNTTISRYKNMHVHIRAKVHITVKWVWHYIKQHESSCVAITFVLNSSYVHM